MKPVHCNLRFKVSHGQKLEVVQIDLVIGIVFLSVFIQPEDENIRTEKKFVFLRMDANLSSPHVLYANIGSLNFD